MIENTGGVNRLDFIDRNIAKPAGEAKDDKKAPNFTDNLFEALGEVNQLQVQADQATEDLLTGDLDNIHQVMIKTEEARLSLQLTGQVVNKVLDAYQEISRMQI